MKSKFISLIQDTPACTPVWRVLIDRKGFKRRGRFATLKEAEEWRDEQMKQMPPSAREKQPQSITPPAS